LWIKRIATETTDISDAMAISFVLDDFSQSALYLIFVTLAVLVLSIPLVLSSQPQDHDASLSRTHLKVGTPLPETSLRDQGSAIHRAQPGCAATIQTLFIYPIKSCRGIELTRSRVLPSGLEFDRLFTFAQKQSEMSQDEDDETNTTWTFITQRQKPLLANVRVDLWQPVASRSSSSSSWPERRLGGVIVVTFPCTEKGTLRNLARWVRTKATRGIRASMERSFMLPIDFPSAEDIVAKGYKYGNVKVWSETVSALNLARDVPPELGNYLGVKGHLGLFMMDPSRQREVFDNAPTKEVAGYQPVVDFQDSVSLTSFSANLTTLDVNMLSITVPLTSTESEQSSSAGIHDPEGQ
jgi:uncharacterized protein YcbX